MKIIAVDSAERMSRIAADIFIGEICRDKRVNVSITAGQTPLRAYELIIEEMSKCGGFKNVHFYNFDEVPILDKTGNRVAYETLDALTDIFYKPASIPENQIHHLNEKNYQDFDRQLLFDGGLDFMLLGLGGDGHFCANMPQTTKLDFETYKFDASDEYPWIEPFQKTLGENHFDVIVTMGPRAVLKSRRLVMMVSGKNKADILQKCLEGEITEKYPASLLKLHHDYTVIADRDALSAVSDKTLWKYA